MKIKIKIGGKVREVEATREADRVRCRLDGSELDFDAAAISAGTFSILIGGRAFEARVETAGGSLHVLVGGEKFAAEVIDSRAWRGRRGHAIEVEGRLQITAPMPGKIVRVLVREGEKVEAGRGIAVVEAMKMQNEVRSRKTGTVQKLLVTEGMAVNAGEILAIVV